LQLLSNRTNNRENPNAYSNKTFPNSNYITSKCQCIVTRYTAVVNDANNYDHRRLCQRFLNFWSTWTSVVTAFFKPQTISGTNFLSKNLWFLFLYIFFSINLVLYRNQSPMAGNTDSAAGTTCKSFVDHVFFTMASASQS